MEEDGREDAAGGDQPEAPAAPGDDNGERPLQVADGSEEDDDQRERQLRRQAQGQAAGPWGPVPTGRLNNKTELHFWLKPKYAKPEVCQACLYMLGRGGMKRTYPECSREHEIAGISRETMFLCFYCERTEECLIHLMGHENHYFTEHDCPMPMETMEIGNCKGWHTMANFSIASGADKVKASYALADALEKVHAEKERVKAGKPGIVQRTVEMPILIEEWMPAGMPRDPPSNVTAGISGLGGQEVPSLAVPELQAGDVAQWEITNVAVVSSDGWGDTTHAPAGWGRVPAAPVPKASWGQVPITALALAASRGGPRGSERLEDLLEDQPGEEGQDQPWLEDGVVSQSGFSDLVTKVYGEDATTLLALSDEDAEELEGGAWETAPRHGRGVAALLENGLVLGPELAPGQVQDAICLELPSEGWTPWQAPLELIEIEEWVEEQRHYWFDVWMQWPNHIEMDSQGVRIARGLYRALQGDAGLWKWKGGWAFGYVDPTEV